MDECRKRSHTQGFPQPPLSSETPSDAMLRAAPLLTMRPSAASKGQLGPELSPVEISERHLALRGGTCTETLVLGKDTSFFFSVCFAVLADKILQPQDHQSVPFYGSKQDSDPVQSLFIYDTVCGSSIIKDDWEPSMPWFS